MNLILFGLAFTALAGFWWYSADGAGDKYARRPSVNEIIIGWFVIDYLLGYYLYIKVIMLL
ncbi:MAG: hypothetical protein UMV23_06760 [Halanaerobium sp.]|nr:hypothetical protein [Halanaerobium sp.]